MDERNWHEEKRVEERVGGWRGLRRRGEPSFQFSRGHKAKNVSSARKILRKRLLRRLFRYPKILYLWQKQPDTNHWPILSVKQITLGYIQLPWRTASMFSRERAEQCTFIWNYRKWQGSKLKSCEIYRHTGYWLGNASFPYNMHWSPIQDLSHNFDFHFYIF